MSAKKAKVKKRRDRNALTFYERIAVIRHHDTYHMSRNSLARMFQCCTTQIRRILERKDELLTQWQAMSEKGASDVIAEMNRKRRDFEMKAIAFILYQWVERCRQLQLNMIINNNTLKAVALKMAAVLNIPHFRPTPRWIHKFRSKYKYKNENLQKPANSTDPQGSLSVEDIIIEYKHYLPSFMQQEISNIITSNTLRDSGGVAITINQTEANQSASKQGNGDREVETDQEEEDGEADGQLTIDEFDESDASDVSSDEPSAQGVLQYLSVVQQFLLLKADYQALSLATQLEDHIKQKYDVTEQLVAQGTDDIIVIE